MFPPSPLNRLAPQGYQMPDPSADMNQQVDPAIQNPLMALAGSQAATGDTSPLLNLLKQHIMSMPQQQDYAPSKTRQVLAAIAGAGAGASPAGMSPGQPIGFRFDPSAAISTTNAINRQPYNTTMAGFDDKAKMLEAGAGVEERANAITARQNELKEQNRIREKEQDEQNRIRQEESERKAAANKADEERKLKEAQDRADKAEKDRAEKQREADLRQGNAEAIEKLRQAQFEALKAQRDLDNTRKDNILSETIRQHDLRDKESKAAIDAANKRADDAIAERKREADQRAADKDREKDVTTVNPPTWYQRIAPSIFGTGTEGKTTKTTYTPMPGKAVANPSGGNIPEKAPPATSNKPGGKWITLPSGRQVYQDPPDK